MRQCVPSGSDAVNDRASNNGARIHAGVEQKRLDNRTFGIAGVLKRQDTSVTSDLHLFRLQKDTLVFFGS